MDLHLVTGYAGAEHVTSADQGAFHGALLLKGSYVLNEGNKFKASIVSNNLIKVMDGDIIMQGRYIRLDAGDYAEVNIENGMQDYKRNDLIVVRYTKNATTGVESASFVVIKGTPDMTEATDPDYISDSIFDGVLTADFPLYRISLDGLNVQEPVALFEVIDNFDARLVELAEKKLNKTGAASNTTVSFEEAETLAELKTGSKLSVLFGGVAKAVSSLISHLANKSNPHKVTKTQIGLSNVLNVSTNNQAPTYTVASANANLSSGETLSTAFGKIAKAIASLITHLADSTIHFTAAERTKLSGIATGANAYTHPNSGVTAGTYRSVTVNAQGHVTAGTNPTVTVAQGGTGATTAAAARTNLGVAYGTAAGTVCQGNDSRLSDARTPKSHNQAASTITAGTLGGQVKANATAVKTITTAQVRDIYAGTTDLTDGESTLTAGVIYGFYET